MASETAEDAFSVLQISMPPLPSYPHQTLHEVRLRRNAPKVPTPTDSRTLFLKNVPADATESHLRAVFASLVGPGRFESASFPDTDARAAPLRGSGGEIFEPAAAAKMAALGGRKRKRGSAADEGEPALPAIWARRAHKTGATALVTLADEKSLQLVLKAVAKAARTKKHPAWSSSAADEPAMGAEWITAHLRLARADKPATQAAVHAAFARYNAMEAEAAEAAKRLRSEPDADGFVTVTRGGRAAPASKSSAEEARRKMAEKEAKKAEDMKGFYRFQLREARKEEQSKMRRRFEEDRKRVEGMKERRGKFKPEA
ncbi:related to RRP7 Protein involved in pre-rRNA processing and ribosome assembly [Cephalotrichum gorgonifer]|uniref:Related to RRP7 Protein involved in pre-rRNA processing and ribosome assembly n=1 Tax=Cephalotrichum gorgonifer TaxID=2041049 RepID=A0AAE8MS13_9PEZI|nr:related to RRP7 Protein involved in pre-rRNA processing and ribosome assembly [Cephalotrichum gorgonifer]